VVGRGNKGPLIARNMQKFKECLQKLILILNHDLNKYSINLFVIAVGSEVSRSEQFSIFLCKLVKNY